MDAFTQNISEIINSGKFVDDQIVVDIIKNLQMNSSTFMNGEYAGVPGLILDGVPRTLKQAEMLDEISNVDLVINFFNKDEVLLQKLAGRRVCPCCNKNFNLADVNTECGYQMSPLLPKGDDHTVCDVDHGAEPVKLITRNDDQPDIILERLETYK